MHKNILLFFLSVPLFACQISLDNQNAPAEILTCNIQVKPLATTPFKRILIYGGDRIYYDIFIDANALDKIFEGKDNRQQSCPLPDFEHFYVFLAYGEYSKIAATQFPKTKYLIQLDGYLSEIVYDVPISDAISVCIFYHQEKVSSEAICESFSKQKIYSMNNFY